MTFEEFLFANGQSSFAKKKEEALRQMFCSKAFLSVKDPAKFRHMVENNAPLMRELLARIAYLYEQDLDKCAEYKQAYVENEALRAQIVAERASHQMREMALRSRL